MVGQGSAVVEDALGLVRGLLVAARLWSSDHALDLGEVATLRGELLGLRHRAHLDGIPAYARLCVESGLDHDSGQAELRARAVVSDGWFKSYDPAGLTDPDRLTGWLQEISSVRVDGPVDTTDLASWRAALRAYGVYVTFSSGTGGAPSVVPRDELTLAALRNGSGVRQPWSLPAGEYDCLLLTDPGMGSGIQAGAAGIAADAFRSLHHELPAQTVEFLRNAAAQARPVVVYGAPARLVGLLDDLDGREIESAPGSCVVTGGGWKSSGGGDVWALLDRAGAALGVARSRCLDTYSWSELNTVLLSCPHDRYHVPPIVEAVVVDEFLRPVEGDADGRLAVLDPMAASYPGMIATSDLVQLRHDACPCGRTGQTLLAGIRRMPGAPPRGCGTASADRPT